MTEQEREYMREELAELAASDPTDANGYRARADELAGLNAPPPVFISSPVDEPISDEDAAAVSRLFRAVYQKFTRPASMPCPRCGQPLAELRASRGCREDWECSGCGFGFDLPADPVE